MKFVSWGRNWFLLMQTPFISRRLFPPKAVDTISDYVGAMAQEEKPVANQLVHMQEFSSMFQISMKFRCPFLPGIFITASSV